MKENKNVNYKARLWIDENSELHGISFANRQIPLGLFDMLNGVKIIASILIIMMVPKDIVENHTGR